MRLKEKFAGIFPVLAEKFPDPKSELKFSNHFQLLVAVMLSAQATDVSVNKATESLFKIVTGPQELIELGETELFGFIKTSEILLEKFNGEVPSSYEELITLPGVGSKTAKVVLNVGFNQPTVAVDTHIFRVAQRLKLSRGKTPDQVSDDLTKNVPREYLLKAHHYLLLHGRYTCRAQNPRCELCELKAFCSFKKKQI